MPCDRRLFKEIVGYDLSDSLNAVRALKMAKQKGSKDSLIHHSDRGLQYCCDDYQKVLKKHKIKCSMTESYDPYANAVAERVNRILKDEFMLEQYQVDMQIMQKLIKDSIEIYNSLRPHYSCFMLTPDQMHKQKDIKIRSYKKKTVAKVTLQRSNKCNFN